MLISAEFFCLFIATVIVVFDRIYISYYIDTEKYRESITVY